VTGHNNRTVFWLLRTNGKSRRRHSSIHSFKTG